MANRLAGATSPYLLQHAGNPVDWHEWGSEALERARREDKPILLSIGYAACHWCHVMERESFEDAETAAQMNESFVCVKVDREERPDLDAIYMSAVQAMTGHGGWPMTMFLAPDGTPLYGGTYFPPQDRHGLPAFRRVLAAVADAWRKQRDGLMEQGGKLVESIARVNALPASPAGADLGTVRAAFDAICPAFDDEWGGFGHAPKFPQPMNLDFLLRCVRLGFEQADEMLATTLTRMARGGIFDQVGGGFHRYSVDAVWLVPHFEKMLYDNAQLLALYADATLAAATSGSAALARHASLWRATAIATGEYLLREMRHADGGYFSSQDADSEGVEGKFYVWPHEELVLVAGDDADLAASYWSASAEGNFEGANIPWVPRLPEAVAHTKGVAVADLEAAVERARARLFAERSERVRPGTDDKVLASWNGLAIAGLARAGRAFGRDDFVAAARDAATFVLSRLRDAHGRLLRSWRDGRTSGAGYLDDYALVALGLLDLHETTFEEVWYAEARALADAMIALFADPAGGFFDTGSDAESLVVRPKDVFDNAVPSGNSAAARLLLRLGALTGEASYRDRAEATLRLTHGAMPSSPLGFGWALCALDDATSGIREVAVAGAPDAESTRALARVVWERPSLPHVLAAGDPSASSVPLLAGRAPSDGRATAYVCERFACKLPVDEPAALAEQLSR